MSSDDDLIIDSIGRQVFPDDESMTPQFDVWIHPVTDAEGMGLPTAWRSDCGDEHTFIQPP
ncbi:hypothetical protein BCB70_03655 [Cutibacterium modestum]|uniref:Uncharacterized protein n=1 Tax=Cutibacterium modestum HL044PA1 TaxID=765109 RepID=A0ABP2K811_9ACTN|nr:hypothetical protein BCB70_03655 [Cutibacterium modestum]EFS73073.1 hypothetical protein HMPREF9621_02114 [Cutibacterium modestum HL037PA2]EFS93046.1 hypothetical protein HMPREF9607_00677 [Cutibacterium modestum HL044PA1]EFT16487.1 hypothetical protein HMPREF9622_00479 [Cutibacterium modestum HL037PA3]